MADPRLFRLRVVFVKSGRLAMLSHLELCRALERAVRRAKLPYAVSQGFSPHMRIAFGAALPVGVGGSHEFFDLFLENYVAPDKALAALKAASAEDLMVQSCSYVEHSAPAASVAFPVCTYRVTFSAQPEELVVPETVSVVRKKKEKTLNVSEFMRGSVRFEGEDIDECSEGSKGLACAVFTLESKPTGSLRPDLLMAKCVEATVAAGKAPEGFGVVTITRIAQTTLEGESL